MRTGAVPEWMLSMVDLAILVPLLLAIGYVLRQLLIATISLLGAVDLKRTAAASEMLKHLQPAVPRRHRRSP